MTLVLGVTCPQNIGEDGIEAIAHGDATARIAQTLHPVRIGGGEGLSFRFVGRAGILITSTDRRMINRRAKLRRFSGRAISTIEISTTRIANEPPSRLVKISLPEAAIIDMIGCAPSFAFKVSLLLPTAFSLLIENARSIQCLTL